MTPNLTNNEVSNETPARQSTYALLVRSEEKERNLFEAAIYALFILCGVVAVWQFVQQPVPVRTHIGNEEATLAVNVCGTADAGC